LLIKFTKGEVLWFQIHKESLTINY
jgi:hypothetical protein